MQGLEGAVMDIEEYEGQLYFGTLSGVYRYNQFAKVDHRKFEIVYHADNTPTLIPTEDGLLLGGSRGLALLENGQAHRIGGGDRRFITAIDGESALTMNARGLERIKEGALHERLLGSRTAQVSSITISANGDLWASLIDQSVMRVFANADYRDFKYYGPESGLVGEDYRFLRAGDRLIAYAQGGDLLGYDESSDRFAPLDGWASIPSDDFLSSFQIMIQDDDDVIWVNQDAMSGELSPLPAGDYFRGLKNLAGGSDFRATAFFIDSKGFIWIANSSGVVKTRLDFEPPKIRDIETRITGIFDLDRNESIYERSYRGGSEPLKIPFSRRSLRFEFALLNFETPFKIGIR